MNIAPHVVLSVSDEVMNESFIIQMGVRAVLIAVDGRALFNGAFDNAIDGFLPLIRHNLSMNLALAFAGVALHEAEYRSLARSTTAIFPLALRLVHVPRQSADIGFIHFNGFALTTKVLDGVTLHRQTNSVKHEPCALLGNSNGAMDLIGRNPILAIDNHPSRHEPFIQTDGRVFHDSSDLDGKLALRMLVSAL